MTNEAILETLKVQPLTEEEKQAKHILKRLTGPIASCKEGTRNGRKYSKELWENALNDDIFKERVANKGLFLELGHPADREEIDMSLVCACIPEMPKIIDDDLYAVVDVLDTPNGKLLNTLIDYGFVPGISSRGSGDLYVDDDGEEAVDPETFFLETWDIVNVPALKKARLSVNESLQNTTTMKQALCESLENASDEDRKVMQEALNNLNIKLDSNSEESENTQVSEPTEELKEEPVEANNDGSEELIKSLQEALKEKSELEERVKSLQEQVAVSDTKVTKLEEDLEKSKSTILRLTTLARNSRDLSRKVSTLEEELQTKGQTIDKLTKEKEELEAKSGKEDLTESLNTKDVTIKELNESLDSARKHESELQELNESLEKKLSDSTTLVEELNTKLTNSEKLKEGYKKLANDSVSKYIELRAKNIGVTSNEIRSRLSARYTLKDIDKVCEDLQAYEFNASQLPYLVEKKVKVKINENQKPESSSVEDDDVDDELLMTANLL